jgi:hypothetical protein
VKQARVAAQGFNVVDHLWYPAWILSGLTPPARRPE